jgi:hypothetical protein
MEQQTHANKIKNILKSVRKNAGYLTLLSVLIIGAVALGSALFILEAGANAARNTIVREESLRAQALADACAESGLLTIKNTESLPQAGGIDFGYGHCEFTTEESAPSEDLVKASGFVESVVRKVKISASVTTTIHETGTTTSITAANWQEVADF